MAMLVIGLIVFLGTHSIAIVNEPWRDRMEAMRCESPAKRTLNHGFYYLDGSRDAIFSSNGARHLLRTLTVRVAFNQLRQSCCESFRSQLLQGLGLRAAAQGEHAPAPKRLVDGQWTD